MWNVTGEILWQGLWERRMLSGENRYTRESLGDLPQSWHIFFIFLHVHFSVFCLFWLRSLWLFYLQILYDLFKEHGLNVGNCGPWKEQEGQGKVPLKRPSSRSSAAEALKETAKPKMMRPRLVFHQGFASGFFVLFHLVLILSVISHNARPRSPSHAPLPPPPAEPIIRAPRYERAETAIVVALLFFLFCCFLHCFVMFCFFLNISSILFRCFLNFHFSFVSFHFSGSFQFLDWRFKTLLCYLTRRWFSEDPCFFFKKAAKQRSKAPQRGDCVSQCFRFCFHALWILFSKWQFSGISGLGSRRKDQSWSSKVGGAEGEEAQANGGNEEAALGCWNQQGWQDGFLMFFSAIFSCFLMFFLLCWFLCFQNVCFQTGGWRFLQGDDGWLHWDQHQHPRACGGTGEVDGQAKDVGRLHESLPTKAQQTCFSCVFSFFSGIWFSSSWKNLIKIKCYWHFFKLLQVYNQSLIKVLIKLWLYQSKFHQSFDQTLIGTIKVWSKLGLY